MPITAAAAESVDDFRRPVLDDSFAFGVDFDEKPILVARLADAL